MNVQTPLFLNRYPSDDCMINDKTSALKNIDTIYGLTLFGYYYPITSVLSRMCLVHIRVTSMLSVICSGEKTSHQVGPNTAQLCLVHL